MKTSLRQLKDTLKKAIQKAGFEIEEGDLHLDKTKTLEHGHFATNIALTLARKLGKRPQEVAEAVVKELEKEGLITKAEVADPGFVNLFIEQKFYSTICQSLAGDLNGYLKGELELAKGKTMLMDYSHPNIAKPMGVHHLLSTIIGDSIKKIYTKMGYKVIGDNYLGDMGTQFGKLIYAIKNWGDEKVIRKNPISELLKLYIKFHNEAEKNPDLEDKGREEFRKFEEGDKQNRDLWEVIVEWSKMEFQPIYDRLNVKFDYMNGESFYEDKMQEVLEKGREKGVFVDGEGGSWIVMPDDPNDTPAIVRKSDGSSIYLTRDLAQTAYWERTWHPELMVWVVDVAQSFHFKQRFHASHKLNQTPARMIHVKFGRMNFKEGGMSTRKGNIIKLSKVLDEAEKRSLELISEKNHDLDEKAKTELARLMGIGAIKYNILHQNRIHNMTFDWDKMLTFEGNSAPYLMYTIARAKSILRKAGISDVRDYELVLSDDLETKVVLDLLMYPDALQRAFDEFKPNHIANFLYHLAQNFNTLYNALPVIKAEESLKKSRLLITGAVIRVMQDAFGLLGLEVPDKM